MPLFDVVLNRCLLRKTAASLIGQTVLKTTLYSGWLAHWGDAAMVNRTSASIAGAVRALLAADASFSLYMALGGSNWAFGNGANTGAAPAAYAASLPSYDYDAPVAQDGADGYGADGRNKFAALRAAMRAESRPAPPYVSIHCESI